MNTVRRICVFLIPILLFSFSRAQTPGDRRIGPIVSALQGKEFEKALALLHPALASSPRDAQLWAMQGTAYAGEGNSKQALISFRNSLKISPDYLPALHGAAQIEYEAGSPAAIPRIEHVLRLRPGDLTSNAMLAVLEYQKGDYARAVVHFGNAGALFDSQPSALHAYAVCLVKLKQFDQAIKVFERALSVNPGDEKERRLLAAIQVMAHQPTEALDTLQPLLQMSSPDSETLELASSAYEEAKDTSNAVSTLRQAILLDPQNVNLYLDFAGICYEHNSYQVGIDVINDGMALLQQAAPLYFVRGVLYVKLEQYEKGGADFEKAYELDPKQSLSAAAQGLVAAQQNDFDRALKQVQASLVKKPKDPLLLYLQADILAEKRPDPGTAEFQRAVESARTAVALQPSLGAAEAVLGKLYLHSGKYEEAAVECRKALAADPKDQAAVYYLIQSLRRTGHQGEIPDLLKKLALLRRQAQQDDRDHYRYKLVEEGISQ
jgi:tetratricopeptide (TPR) repeat protein